MGAWNNTKRMRKRYRACSVTREGELENILEGRFEGRINVSSWCAHLLFSLISSLADGFTVFTDHIIFLY